MFLFWISDLCEYDEVMPYIQIQFVKLAIYQRPKYFTWLQLRATFALML